MRWTRHALIQGRAIHDPDQIQTRTYYGPRPRPVDPRSCGTTAAPAPVVNVRTAFDLPDGFAWDRPRLVLVRCDPAAVEDEERAIHLALVDLIEKGRKPA